MEMLILHGSKPAVIDAISADVTPTSSARFLGARLALPGRSNDFNENMVGFPPKAVHRRLQIPAIGATLQPHTSQSYMLILGYRDLNGEMGRRRTITIDYTVSGKQYRAVFPADLYVCPWPLTDTECSKRYPVPY